MIFWIWSVAELRTNGNTDRRTEYSLFSLGFVQIVNINCCLESRKSKIFHDLFSESVIKDRKCYLKKVAYLFQAHG